MDIKVRMLAFGEPKEIRIVDVPKYNFLTPFGKDTKSDLEIIFYWGQNDFQPQNHPSVSEGDVVEYNNKFYMCLGIGFTEISEQDLIEYESLKREDRFNYRLKKYY